MRTFTLLFSLTALATAAVGQEAVPSEPPVAAAPVVQETVVTLAASAAVTGELIALGDVAALPQDNPLRAITLAPAPLPGGQRVLTQGQVAVRLARAGYDQRAVTVAGAESVVVTRAAQMLSPDDVALAVMALVKQPAQVDRVPPLPNLPVGVVTYRLRSAVPNPLAEMCSLPLDILVDGQVAHRLTVSLRPTPATAAPELAPTTVAAAAPAAAPVRPVASEPVFELKRGDAVTVVATAGRVTVSLQGSARSTGRIGELVTIEVLINGKRTTLSARLIAPDRALMEL